MKEYDLVKIGKFDIFAAYSFAKGLREGMRVGEAKIYGFSIAVLGARARMGGSRSGGGSSGKSLTDTLAAAAGQKKKTSITAEMYDKQMAKLGPFYKEVFLPAMKEFVSRGMTYNQVKVALAIPSRIGAKISGTEFLRGTK